MQHVRQDLPSIGGSVTIKYGNNSERFLHTGEIPKELMDAYQELVGDGNAKVTVGSDLAIKDFGTGAGAFVSISLTCNQDNATMNKAILLAGQMAQAAAAHFQAQGAVQAKQMESQQRQGPSGAPRYG